MYGHSFDVQHHSAARCEESVSSITKHVMYILCMNSWSKTHKHVNCTLRYVAVSQLLQRDAAWDLMVCDQFKYWSYERDQKE